MKKLKFILAFCTLLTCTSMLGFAEDTAPEAQIFLKTSHAYGLSNSAKFQIDPDNTDVTPFYEGDTMMVPLRFIAERLGYEVTYDGQTQSIEILSDPAIRLVIGEREISVNGSSQTIDQPALERGGRTFVPLRAVSQSLGKTVVWFPNDVAVIGTGSQDSLRQLVEQDMDTILFALALLMHRKTTQMQIFKQSKKD